MKKTSRLLTFIAIALLSVNLGWGQSLRNYVCVVKGNLSPENTEFLSNLKDSLEHNGYSYYADYIGSFLKGTFGSGFIWYAPDGKPYIVSNRHVAGNYESVNISFENDDGSVSEFKEMKIVFSDDDVDVALISLPDNFKKDGLLFTTAIIADGEDVFSAGFPGLAGEPSWQLGKGIVSNSAAKIKELISPDISTLIQHTAQVDGGNSGGPLLIKDSSAKSGYKVCGLNTWSASARQNTNFSIPAQTIEKIVKSNYIQKSTSTFDTRSTAFVKAFSQKDDYSRLIPFISNSMINKYGEKALKDILSKGSVNVRSYISDVFEGNPIEGLRCALAYQVWEALYSESDRIDIKDTSDEASGKKVSFAVGEKAVETFWIEEQGNWKLSEMEGIKAETKKANKDKARNQNGSAFSMEDPYFISFSGGYLRNLSEEDNGFTFDFQYRFNYFSFGLFAMKDSVTTDVKYSDFTYEDSTKKQQNGVFDVGPMITLKLPLKFGNFVVIPFGEAHAGISMPKSFFDSNLKPFYAGIGAGLELTLCTDSIGPYLGAKYMLNNYLQSEPDATITGSSISIFAGIKIGDR